MGTPSGPENHLIVKSWDFLRGSQQTSVRLIRQSAIMPSTPVSGALSVDHTSYRSTKHLGNDARDSIDQLGDVFVIIIDITQTPVRTVAAKTWPTDLNGAD